MRQKAAEAAWDICMVYKEGVIDKSLARKWFAKFKNGNFDIDDTPCSGRPSEFDEDHLKALLKEESHQTSRELAEKMNCNQKMILNYLHSIGFAKKLGVWRKSPSNCFSTSCLPLSNMQSQTVLFVPNRHRRWEMVYIYKYEAKKGMGGFWRYAKAKS